VSTTALPTKARDLRRNLRRLARWVHRGCLLQITGQSLLGEFGEAARDAAVRMLDARLVHFVASDAHNLKRRPPELAQAYEFVLDRWGDAEADRLFIDHPWAALWGDTVEAPTPDPRPQRSWSLFG